MGPNMAHAFYDGDPKQGGQLLGVVRTTKRLEPGQFEDISLTVSNLPLNDVWVAADDDGTGKGVESESDETNNAHHVQVVFIPPQVYVTSPEDRSTLQANMQVLVTGQGIAATTTGSVNAVLVNRIVNVSVKGVPVDALDSAGNFFTRVAVLPGQNTIEIIATDAFGQTSATTLTLTGALSAMSGVDFSVLSDVSASLQGEYGRTAFNEKSSVLYADMAIRNAGQYAADTPLLVGITNLSDPSVRVRDTGRRDHRKACRTLTSRALSRETHWRPAW